MRLLNKCSTAVITGVFSEIAKFSLFLQLKNHGVVVISFKLVIFPICILEDESFLLLAFVGKILFRGIIFTARHTEYDEGYVFSLSVRGGGVPVVQNFATRCPTDLLGGGTVVQNFATRCPTDLLRGGGPKFFFYKYFSPNFFFRCYFR